MSPRSRPVSFFRNILAAALTVILGSAPAGASEAGRKIHGVVFADADGDGRRGPAEPPVAAVAVVADAHHHARSAADGRFTLTTPRGYGLVWARVPAGYRPGPAWAAVNVGTTSIEIGLVPEAPRPGDEVRLLVAADLHLGLGGVDPTEISRALAARASGVCFVALLGDLTQDGRPDQLASVAGMALGAPAVPLPGNHDWYDRGVAYRARFGPPAYSFDVGAWHVVVLGWGKDEASRAAWVALDRRLGDGRPAIALTHAPPGPVLARALAAAGVRAVFSGHAHRNLIARHPGGLIEYATQPVGMGGVDGLPAGWREVQLGADGLVEVSHQIVERAPGPIAPQRPPPGRLAWQVRLPGAGLGGGLARTGEVLLVALADLDGSGSGGVAALDATSGRLRWTAALGSPVRAAPVPAGDLALAVTLDGRIVALDLQRGASRWQVALAPSLPAAVRAAAAPVAMGDGTVYGGVLRDFGAFDLATGQARWRRPIAHAGGDAPSRAAPTLAGDLVLGSFGRGFEGLHALDRATGAEVWRAPDVAVGAQATPLVLGERVVVVDWSGRVSVLSVADGAPRWRRWAVGDAGPWSYAVAATPAAAAGALLVPTMRGDLVALDLATGAPRWTTTVERARTPLAHYPVTPQSANTTPIVAGGLVWLAGIDGVLRALDPATGALRGARRLGHGALASPLADGARLYVATLDDVIAAFTLR